MKNDLDYIIAHEATQAEHTSHLKDVLQETSSEWCKLPHPPAHSALYGHVLSAKGIVTDTEHTDAYMMNVSRPADVLSWRSKHIRKYTTESQPAFTCQRKDTVLQWPTKSQKHFWVQSPVKRLDCCLFNVHDRYLSGHTDAESMSWPWACGEICIIQLHVVFTRRLSIYAG